MSSGRSPTEAYDDVWVLSLPQFVWTQVFSGSRYNYGATCHIIGKKTIFLFGGNENKTIKGCNDTPIVSLFDMTNLKWLRGYAFEESDYNVPKAVSEWINGT
jgi:hypothetical protein